MVYANYTPAKLPTVATELDRAVYAVQNLETLEVLGKLLYNAACAPAEEKYRKIKLSNPKIQTLIAEVPGAVDLLLQIGWVKDDSADEEFLVIPPGKYMTMAQVRMIEEQKDRVKKQAQRAQTDAIRASEGARKPTAAQA